MSKILNIHQSSISHVIRNMIDEDLINGTSRGYRLTNMGQIYILSFNNFNTMLESLTRHKEFIINHDFSHIPANHQMMIGMLFRQRDSMPVNSLKPYYKLEYMKDHLCGSQKIFMVSSIIIPELARSMLLAARNGAEASGILSGEILHSLKTDFVGILDEAFSYETVKVYRNDNAKIFLIVTESHIFFGLHRLDGSFDLDNIIISNEEGARIWGNALFDHFLRGSEKANDSWRRYPPAR